ncbi:MAG TPA: urease accessory protein UreD [Nitrospira sp.]
MRDAAVSPASSRSRKTPAAEPTSSIGRAGTLTVHYKCQDARTVFGRTNCQTPWHLLPPIYLDDSGAAYTLLVNPSGGLVGGDHLSIDMHLDPSAHVLISTPSANRVYRSLAKESRQEIQIRLGAGAVLEWFPEHTIPFAGSRFRQHVDVKLGKNAIVLFWDAVASGRIASGERWAFTSLHNEIRITTAAGSCLLERYALVPKRGGIGLAAEWDYVASLFIVGDGVEEDVWNRLESALAVILDERPGRLLGGVTRPGIPGVAVKLLARSAPDLTAGCDALWHEARRILLGMPAVSWRKY